MNKKKSARMSSITDTVLGKILADKRRHIALCKTAISEDTLDAQLSRHTPEKRAGAFVAGIRAGMESRGFGVIAEIKKASPSKGLLRDPFLPGDIAASYAAGGADAMSVLTDTPYFQGEDAHLRDAIAAAPHIPALRKDFMLEAYQIKEAALMGASCVLLILAALDDATAVSLARCAADCGLDILAEVHDRAELDRALTLPGLTLLGVNNRNLKTLDVSLDVFETLAPAIPAGMIAVCESGIHTGEDMRRMQNAGAQAFLIGERFMREDNPGAALNTLMHL